MGNFKSELKGLEKFQPIPRDLIQDCGLSAQARFIYAYMAAKPEGWEFWQDVMSREVRMGVDTLRKYLYELRDAGWLEIGKQENGGRYGAAQYTLKALPYGKISDTENFRHGENPTRKISDTENFRHIDNIDTKDKTDNKKKKESKDTPAPLILPFSSDRFRETWERLLQNWKECLEPKELKKKTPNALRLLLNRLGKYHEDFAIELMERCIEGGWRGVVFPDTDARYQEWMSARQLKIDNAAPRTMQSHGKPKQFDPNNRVDVFYRDKLVSEEAERARLIAELKAKHGVKDNDNTDGSSGSHNDV